MNSSLLLVLIVTGAIGIVAPIEFLRRFMPKFYFGISEIIHGIDRNITWPSIGIRFSIPVIVATILALGIPDDQVVASSAAAFLAAVLLVWPMLLHPELTDPILHDRRNQLLVLYAMFIATYTVLGAAGGELGIYLRNVLTSSHGIGHAIKSEAAQLLHGVIYAMIGVFLTEVWNRYRKRVQDDEQRGS